MIIYNVHSKGPESHGCPFTPPVNHYPWLFTFGVRAFGAMTTPERAKGPVLVDSGAFVLSNKPEAADRINPELYAKYLEEVIDPAVPAISFDTIGDPVDSWKNWNMLRERMPERTIIPVWHLGTDPDYLYKYLDATDYIGVGGLVTARGFHVHPKRSHLDPFWNVLRKYWPVRVHGLGISSEWALERYPWRSVDSVSWVAPGAFLATPEGQRYKIMFARKAGVRSVKEVDEIMRFRRHSRLVEEFPNETSQERCFDRDLRRQWDMDLIRRTLKATKAKQDHATMLWRHRGITWEGDERWNR